MKPIPLKCSHCGFTLDYIIGGGGTFPPKCENGCRDGYGEKVSMTLRRSDEPAPKPAEFEMSDLVLNAAPQYVTTVASGMWDAPKYLGADGILYDTFDDAFRSFDNQTKQTSEVKP
jgi:hypothetical protein